MLAEFARKADGAASRTADIAYEAVHATVVHARRIVGAVAGAAFRVRREAGDLVWDYRDVASELRRSAEGGDDPAEVVKPLHAVTADPKRYDGRKLAN